MKKLIYSQEDLDLILSLEIEKLEEEIERLKGALQTHEILLKSNVLEIERLNNIINEQGLKDKPNYYVKGLEGSLKEYQEEVKRLNNIINEIEKELKEDYKIWMCNSRSNGKSVKFGIDVCKTHFYNKLQELKGSDKNES